MQDQSSLENVSRGITTQLKFQCREEDFAELKQVYNDEVRYLNGVCYYDLEISNKEQAQIVEPTMLKAMTSGGGGEVTPVIVVSEWGGFNPDDAYGTAQTVCGLSGKPLNPFFISEAPNSNHATFSVPRAVIVCRASHHSDRRWNLVVYDMRFEFDKDTRVASFEISEHWRGSRFNETKRRYVSPMAFAIAKASTPFCGGPAYCQAREYHNESSNQS
jgi:hypothetical protein